jgi:hypothetical protein
LEKKHQDLADGLQGLQGRSHLIRFKERFLTTIESHGLGHIIDKHVIDNLDLDKIQRGWLYKILQDTIQAPQGKSIVTTLMTRILARSGKNERILRPPDPPNPVRSQRT